MADMEAFSDGLMEELLTQAAEEAAQSGQRTNMGRLTYGWRFLEWQNGVPTEVTKDEYAQLNPRNRSAEVIIKINVQELNPELTWSYERRVRINSADWFAHWQRSVIEYYELAEQVDPDLKTKKKQAEIGKLAAQKMQALAGQYVAVNDVPQEKQKDPDVVYRTPELVDVFESREACFAAYEERFGQAPAGATEPPEGYDSYDEFAQAVRMMRDEGGRSNKEIADALGVGVGEVALVS